MAFQPDPDRIVWRVHLRSSPAEVHSYDPSRTWNQGYVDH